ncbi:Quinic acid utilization activator [Fusarium oxysporum f. sp. cubense race 1]|uniref:Quinic acid utilization activator n=1 Tax=Fusarium oxysporum f. sp. cubense (strain race 1) TaxID=1229664 RepID=N4U8M5_FUSC1|nr:Quinic acid utilization activator [Fusarium oxysporum f. sp. cubense race 1]
MDPPAKPKRTRVNKHKRVSRACDYCRARKHRCDGSHPTCSRCSAIHYPCSYGPDSKKRGLTTGYVRALELLWALVFTVVPNSKAVVQELLPDIQFSLDSRSRLVLNSRLVRDYETLRQAWDGSDIQEELDQLLSNIQQGNDSGANSVASVKAEASTPDLAPRVKAFEAVQTSTPANDAREVSDPMDTDRANTPSTHDASVPQPAPWNDVSSPASAQQVSPLPGKVQPGTAPHLTPQLYNLHLAFASTDMHLRSHLTATNGLPSTQTTGLAGLSMGYLMAAFVKEFGVANMPATFKIYQDLGRRKVFIPVRQGHSVDLLVSSATSPNLLPTPPAVYETGPIGTNGPERSSAVSLTRQVEVENLDEYDIETWGKIFGTAELGEAGIPTQQDMESLDYFNGMAW